MPWENADPRWYAWATVWVVGCLTMYCLLHPPRR
jgi:hypothetical protein